MNTQRAHGAYITDRRIFISLWLLETCAAGAAASVGGGLLSFLFWTAVFGVTLGMGADYAHAPQEAKRKRGEYVALVGVLGFVFMLLTANLMRALVTLILWLQAAKNVTVASRRDGYFALAVSFVVLLFAASLSKSSFFLFIVTGYSLAAMYALLLLHTEGLRRGAAGVADLPQRQLPASVIPLTAAVLMVAGLFYLLMPRPPAMLFGNHLDRHGTDYRDQSWEQQAQQSEHDLKASGKNSGKGNARQTGNTTSGRSSSRHLAKNTRHGKHSSSSSDYAGFNKTFKIDATAKGHGIYNGIVLYVQAARPLYLKGRVFDTFDGLSWHAAHPDTVKHLLENGQYRFAGRDHGVQVRQIITVAHALPPIIPAASRVAELDFPGTVFAEDNEGTLSLPRRMAKGTEYEVFSRRSYVADHPAVAGKPDDLAPYLQLPTHFDPRIRQLAKQVTAKAPSKLAAALALERYMRTHYHYTFATVSHQNHIPLAKFLFDTKRGHCEYFATAMTIMLRSRGIPARLVTGFSATNYNPLTGYYEVRGIDGHAWTEAYLPPHGWVTFEPTAFYHLPKEQPPPATARALDNYVQQLKRIATQTDPKGLTTHMLAAVAAVFTGIRQAISHVFQLLRQMVGALGPGLLTAATLIALLGWVIYLARRPLLDRWGALRVARGAPADIAWIAYREMEAWFARRGYGRAPGQTVEEYVRRLAARRRRFATPTKLIAAFFSHHRYGGVQPNPGEIKTIRQAFTQVTTPHTTQGKPNGSKSNS